MTAHTVFIFFSAIVLLWIKPGPGQAFRIAATLNDNFLAGFAISIGVVISCNIFLLVAIFSASLITAMLNDAAFFFKILGGIYLIYLGLSAFNPTKVNITKTKAINNKTFLKYVSIGLLLSLSNPIDIVFFAGILPGIVDITSLSLLDVSIAMLIMSATGLCIDAIILSMVAKTKVTLMDSKHVKSLRNITSIGFILLGLFFLAAVFKG